MNTRLKSGFPAIAGRWRQAVPCGAFLFALFLPSAARAAPDGAAPPLDEAVAAAERAPAAALALVRERVAFRPYAGLVKGAAGAWQDGTANATDAAELLAEVLRRMRIPARLAFGELPEPAVTALLETALAPTPPPKSVHDKLPGEPADPAADPGLRAAVAAHVWVQAQWQGQWLDLDPVIHTLDAGTGATPATRTAARAPAGERRRLRVEVMAVSGSGQPRRVLRHEAAVDEMFGQRLALASMAADGKPRSVPVEEMQPVLIAAGRLIRGTVYGGPAAAVRSSPAGRLGGVFEQVDGPVQGGATALDEVFVDFTLTGGGRPDRSQRRYLYVAGDAGLNRLADITSYCVAFGAPAPHLAGELIKALEARVGPDRDRGWPAEGAPSPGQQQAADELFQNCLDLTALMAMRLAAATHALLADMDAAYGTLSDYGEVRLLAVSLNPLQRRLSTDLIFDAVSSWARAGSKRTAPWALRLSRGLLAADVEGELLAAGGGQGADAPAVVTVRAVFQAAKDAGIEAVPLAPDQRAPLDGLQLPALTKRLIVERLDAGRLLVVTSRSVTLPGWKEPVAAWYEFDPAANEWAGVLGDGRHQSMTEYRRVRDIVAVGVGWVSCFISSYTGALWAYSTQVIGLIGTMDYLEVTRRAYAAAAACDKLGYILYFYSTMIAATTQSVGETILFTPTGWVLMVAGQQQGLLFIEAQHRKVGP